MTYKTDYFEIVKHYETCLAKYGDTHRGVDWPNEIDAKTRYRAMLEVIRPKPESRTNEPLTILDFGCGAGHLLEYLRTERRDDVRYIGLDISSKFIDLCQRKFPEVEFLFADILQLETEISQVDYVVMNGVFTEKRSMSYDDMFEYFCKVIRRAYQLSRRGIAFNVMSKQVDWERDDLFHLSFDVLARFLRTEISRNYQFRADYGLYEYTTYVYR